MKIPKAETCMIQELLFNWGLAYVGGFLLKIASISLIKSFPFKTIGFSACLVSAGTLFAKKRGLHLFKLDFDKLSESRMEHFFKIALVIASAMGILITSQCHRFTLAFPRFTYLSFRNCLVLGMAQEFSVAIPLLWDLISMRQKPKKIETDDPSSHEKEALYSENNRFFQRSIETLGRFPLINEELIDIKQETHVDELDALEENSVYSEASDSSDSIIIISQETAVDLENLKFFENGARAYRREMKKEIDALGVRNFKSL